MNNFKFYEVGGKVRDEILGFSSKDIDYVAVPSEDLLKSNLNADGMFEYLRKYLIKEKFEIFLTTPNCFTIRAKFPKGYKYQGTADFVMARKEIGYIKETRIPIIEPGNLYDDLSRRDFTINALAKDPNTNEIIDYFNGLEDLKNKILRTPLDPIVTFDDDPLRILRGIRFMITHNFNFEINTINAIIEYDYSKMKVVSQERIREELYKCFKYDTWKTMSYLCSMFTKLFEYLKNNTTLWLKPTSEKY